MAPGTAFTTRLGVAGAFLALVPSMTGCEDGPVSTAPTASAERRPIAVTRDDSTYPAACRPGAVARSIQRFLELQGGGNPDAVDHVDFETPPPGGGFYADSANHGEPGGSATAASPEQLAEYLAARHARHEQLRLVELRVAYDPGRGIGNFEYKILRRADDVPVSKGAWNTEGKGGLECDGGKIVAWSASTIPAPERTGTVCPRASESARKRRAIVACAARARRTA